MRISNLRRRLSRLWARLLLWALARSAAPICVSLSMYNAPEMKPYRSLYMCVLLNGTPGESLSSPIRVQCLGLEIHTEDFDDV